MFPSSALSFAPPAPNPENILDGDRLVEDGDGGADNVAVDVGNAFMQSPEVADIVVADAAGAGPAGAGAVDVGRSGGDGGGDNSCSNACYIGGESDRPANKP